MFSVFCLYFWIDTKILMTILCFNLNLNGLLYEKVNFSPKSMIIIENFPFVELLIEIFPLKPYNYKSRNEVSILLNAFIYLLQYIYIKYIITAKYH